MDDSFCNRLVALGPAYAVPLIRNEPDVVAAFFQFIFTHLEADAALQW